MKDKVKLKDIIRNVGSRSVAALVAVFLLTIAVTGIGCYQLYKSTKESIHLQGRVNAVQSAKEFDDYLYNNKYNPGTTADLTAASIFVSNLKSNF